MRALAAAVEATPVPTASSWVKCADGVASPCPQADAAEGRACGKGTADYDEYQALLSIPIFQQGTAPYLKEGGAISSTVQRTEAVCMSMSIPKSTAPAAGWPLVVYGHGTGGSYRGALRDAIAGRLARATPVFATLTIDAVEHGPRRGEGPDAENDPDNLFFNFLNPDAARGNPLQGAADVLSVLRFANTSTLATAVATGGDAITVDPTKVFLYGHSQGSTHASMALPFSLVSGGVLSGNGGGLALALMNKTNPVNIAGAVPFALQDVDPNGQLRMGEKHPAIGLLQHYIDPSDPINFAPLLTVRPEAGRTVKHVLQTFGLDDTYAPPETLAAYIYAAELALAEPPSGVSATGDNDLGMSPAVGPVTLNVTLVATTVTAVCRQYEPPADSDGHFVAEVVPEATDDVIGFLSSLGAGSPPVVPAP
jgi:predicted esterase